MDLKNTASQCDVPTLEPGGEIVDEGIDHRLPLTSPALFAVELSPLSKPARCYLLAAKGGLELPLMPRVAEAVVADPARGIDATVHDALGECLAQIATNLVVVGRLDDAEGPHQLRTGLRRVRCVFSIYAPVLKCAESDRLDRESKWLAREIGGLRDLDVTAGKIAFETEANPFEPSLRPIAARLARRAEECRRRLRRRLAHPRLRMFLIDLAHFVEHRSWTGARKWGNGDRIPAATKDIAEIAILERWKATCEASQGLDRLDFDRCHAFRKEIRKLRYAIEFLRSLFPESQVRPLLRLLRNLQTLLGDVNDASVIKAALEKEALIEGDAELKHALGWLIRAQDRHAQSDWIGAKSVRSEYAGKRSIMMRLAPLSGAKVRLAFGPARGLECARLPPYTMLLE